MGAATLPGQTGGTKVKASELIKILEAAVKEHGDLPVMYASHTGEFGYFYPDYAWLHDGQLLI